MWWQCWPTYRTATFEMKKFDEITCGRAHDVPLLWWGSCMCCPSKINAFPAHPHPHPQTKSFSVGNLFVFLFYFISLSNITLTQVICLHFKSKLLLQSHAFFLTLVRVHLQAFYSFWTISIMFYQYLFLKSFERK